MDPARDLDHGFRHAGWKHDRERIYAALVQLPVSHTRKDAFAHCGQRYMIFRRKDDPERFKLVPAWCHDRLCIPCGTNRRATISDNLNRLIGPGRHRLITLTIRHGHEPLDYLVRRLYRCFRRLRQRALWKDRVIGGVALLEVKYTPEADTWHPHLHLIVEGRYIDYPDLRQAWLAVTGDSYNVDIRLIRDKRRAIGYVAKYATKPLPSPVLRCDWLLHEAIPVLARKRTVLTFGTWSRWRILHHEPEPGWQMYDHLEHVRYLAYCYDDFARNIVAMLPTAHPATGEFYVWDDGPALDDSS